ncbi:thioredoxin family protein [Desulfobacterium sp. N47]|uniref:peptidylprolyl isomerase n=1 Tax=uncultured Desulfobacterium sp. TaxID=201089 RepID=E1YK37_9BACT|nr:hypothetical protein N47_E51530 [uncultured Desulfobacterium sp.]
MVWKNGLITIVTAALFFGCAGTHPGLKEHNQVVELNAGVQEESPEKKVAMKTLENAFQQAKQTGKSVSIDVGQEDPATVEKGDLALVNYTASLQNGSLIYTTIADIAKNTKKIITDGVPKNEKFGPDEIVAGNTGFIPAVGSLVIGMKQGEKKTVTLPPEKAFGPSDPKKIAQFPCKIAMPKNLILDPRAYVEKFNAFPIVGREVELTPYFKSRVTEVAENHVKLSAMAKGGERSVDSFGTTVVNIEGDQIIIMLTPILGADFEMNDRKGKIVSTDGTTLTVDFNPPLAGKSVVLDLEVVSNTKASAFEGMEITWAQNYEQGIEEAKKEDKPVFLLLYAPWCGWSKKTMEDTMEDPRIKMLKDRFVWVKVNTDERKELYEFYQQKGYPLMIILDSKGEEIKRIDGYRDGAKLSAELKSIRDSEQQSSKRAQTENKVKG